MKIPFSELLYLARKQMGFTQAELGKRIGVTGSSVCAWEKEYNYPRFIRLQRLANVLRVKVKYFWAEK